MKNENVPRNFDDLVFEHRNKLYGAYAIRRSYSDNVNKGLMIAALAIVCLTFGPRLFPGAAPIAPPILDGSVIAAGEIPRILTDLPPPASHPVVRTVRNTNMPPQVVAHHVPDAPVEPPQGPSTQGTPGAEPGDPVPSGPGVVEPVVAAVPVAPAAPTIFITAERMPQYAGGMEAMVRYLQRQLRYPAVDRRMGVEGTVYVSFVIDQEGNVTMAKVVKGISATCDEEALRVINKMPTWSPGMQSNVPVMVRMVLPIKFSLAH